MQQLRPGCTMASTRTSGSSVSPSSSTPRATKPDKATQQLGILDLPSETQHTIFSHVSDMRF